MMEKVCELTVFVLETLVSGVFFIQVLQAKHNKTIQVFLPCCINIVFLFTDISVFRYLIIFIIDFCFVLFLFKDDLKKKIAIFIVKQLTVVASLFLSFCFYRNLSTNNFDLIFSNTANNIEFFFIYLMLLSGCFVLLSIHFRKVQKYEYLWILILILSVVFAELFLVLSFAKLEITDFYSYHNLFFIIAMIFSVFVNIEIGMIPSVLLHKMSVKKNIDYSENLSNMEFNYYKMALENDKKLKAIRHDVANHIQTAYFLLENGEKRRGLELLNKIKEDYANVNQIIYCDNPVVNIILSNKKNEAEKNGIETHIKIKDKFDNLSITDFDLSTIICNLIDNAIRGAIVSSQSHPRLIIEMLQKNNFFVIRVLNSCKVNMSIENTDRLETTQSDVSVHGIGMSLVTNIVKKYNGDFVVSAQNGIFIATVVMAIK